MEVMRRFRQLFSSLWKNHPYQVLLFGIWGTYFFTLFPRMIQNRANGLYVGCVNVWSDWSLHIGMATVFAEKPPSQWFAYHPMFADGRFTYPFLTNLISGTLMRMGFSIPFSFVVPSLVFSVFLLLGMHRLLTLTLKSEAKSFATISLFFLGEGVGFIDFIRDFWRDFWSHPSFEMLLYPPVEYGRLDRLGWFSGNFILGILVPQRASLLGMTLALWSLSFLLEVVNDVRVQKRGRSLVLGGLLAGILPITHMHSFMATVLIAGLACAASFRRWKELLPYVATAGGLSTALYLKFVAGGIENPHFMSFAPGYATRKVGEWFYFWGRSWGVTLPLALMGTWFYRKQFTLKRHALLLSAWLLFILGNLFQTQPIHWDNSKLFMWSFLGLSAYCTEVLFMLGSGKRADKVVAAVLILGLTGTGLLELTRLQRIERNLLQVISKDNELLSAKVRIATHWNDRFLTETSHNHWVMMRAARPILMGFVAWVWNFGFNYGQTEQDIKVMYAGGPESEKLLKKHRVSFVVIGPGEMHNYHPNEEYFKQHFSLAFFNSQYRVYDTRDLLADR